MYLKREVVAGLHQRPADLLADAEGRREVNCGHSILVDDRLFHGPDLSFFREAAIVSLSKCQGIPPNDEVHR
jgi:hypothetical protein